MVLLSIRRSLRSRSNGVTLSHSSFFSQLGSLGLFYLLTSHLLTIYKTTLCAPGYKNYSGMCVFCR